MPALYPSPLVSNYFEEIDFGPENRASGAVDRQIVDAFEDGKCIIFRDWIVDFDKEFFSDFELHNNREAKKLKSFVRDGEDVDRKRLEFQVGQCAKDPALVDEFVDHAERISAQVVPLINRIFGNSEYLDRRLTWRLLETVNENLHIDVYGAEKTDFQIRMFVNLDAVPRIWHTSHSLEDMLEKFGHLLTDDELASLGPTALCKVLNYRVFGGVDNAGHDGQPKHTAFFQPGEVWMVDSRRISHQIFYGRRALSCDYLATPQSMNDPSKHYLLSVERYRARRGFTLAA